MATEALITLKTTPAEFDLIREALDFYRDRNLTDGDADLLPPAVRRIAKQKAAQLQLILAKLR
jgi:hypothetical protein